MAKLCALLCMSRRQGNEHVHAHLSSIERTRTSFFLSMTHDHRQKITREIVVASQATMQNEKKKEKKKQKQDRVRCTREAESSARSLSEISFYVKTKQSAVVR